MFGKKLILGIVCNAFVVGMTTAQDMDAGKEALELINQRLNGNYTWSDTAYNSAVQHAGVMAAKHGVFHSARVNEVQECCCGRTDSADGAVRMWQGSSPHRKALIRNAGNPAAVAVVNGYWVFQLDKTSAEKTVTKTVTKTAEPVKHNSSQRKQASKRFRQFVTKLLN
jgi:hypothetical protein